MMRLQSLVGLEIQKIADEIEEKKKLIEYLEGIINDPLKLDQVIKDDFIYIKKQYGDERKTLLSQDLSVYNIAGSLSRSADSFKQFVKFVGAPLCGAATAQQFPKHA